MVRHIGFGPMTPKILHTRSRPLSFAALAWEKTNVETKMALCQSMNTPVANAAYQEDMDTMAQDVALLQQDIDAAQTADERAYLQLYHGVNDVFLHQIQVLFDLTPVIFRDFHCLFRLIQDFQRMP